MSGTEYSTSVQVCFLGGSYMHHHNSTSHVYFGSSMTRVMKCKPDLIVIWDTLQILRLQSSHSTECPHSIYTTRTARPPQQHPQTWKSLVFVLSAKHHGCVTRWNGLERW